MDTIGVASLMRAAHWHPTAQQHRSTYSTQMGSPLFVGATLYRLASDTKEM